MLAIAVRGIFERVLEQTFRPNAKRNGERESTTIEVGHYGATSTANAITGLLFSFFFGRSFLYCRSNRMRDLVATSATKASCCCCCGGASQNEKERGIITVIKKNCDTGTFIFMPPQRVPSGGGGGGGGAGGGKQSAVEISSSTCVLTKLNGKIRCVCVCVRLRDACKCVRGFWMIVTRLQAQRSIQTQKKGEYARKIREALVSR